jgi:hypothetical protein
MDDPRRRFGAMVSGLDIHYDLGAGHPLVGRRMPDLEIVSADGPLRVFALLHDGRGALINFGVPGRVEVSGWADRIAQLDAKYSGVWQLPDVGEVTGPTAVLVRPDGHVAWVGEAGGADLSDALNTWFGPPGA